MVMHDLMPPTVWSNVIMSIVVIDQSRLSFAVVYNP